MLECQAARGRKEKKKMLSQSRKKFDTPNRINGCSPWASVALLQLLLMHAALEKFCNLIKVYMLKSFWYLTTPYKCSQIHSPYRSEQNGVSIKLLQEYFHAFHFILWEFQFCICKWHEIFCFYSSSTVFDENFKWID